MRNFLDFCKRLEATLEDLPTDNKSNEIPGQEKGNKKHQCKNNNDKDIQKHYCMLHGHNPTHSIEKCRTLNKEAEKVKKRSQKWQPQKQQQHSSIIPSKRGDAWACTVFQGIVKGAVQ